MSIMLLLADRTATRYDPLLA